MSTMTLALALTWFTAACFLIAYERERRQHAQLRRWLGSAACDCVRYMVVLFPACTDVAGWHHGHGAGHCHPIEAVDL
jgi:hypothetical protein